MSRLIAAVVGVLALSVVSSAQALAQDATLTLDVTSIVYVSPNQVLVEGTLTCDEPVDGELSIVLTGRLHPGTVVPQPQTVVYPFSCSGEENFSIVVEAVRGIRFRPGQRLSVYASFIVCGTTSCYGTEVSEQLTVTR